MHAGWPRIRLSSRPCWSTRRGFASQAGDAEAGRTFSPSRAGRCGIFIIDYQRAKMSQKRERARARVALDDCRHPVVDADPDRAIGLERVLVRLAEEDPRKGRVVEMLVVGGMGFSEIAKASRSDGTGSSAGPGCAARSVTRDRRFHPARARRHSRRGRAVAGGPRMLDLIERIRSGGLGVVAVHCDARPERMRTSRRLWRISRARDVVSVVRSRRHAADKPNGKNQQRTRRAARWWPAAGSRPSFSRNKRRVAAEQSP
jgi:ECF sigma factor